MNDLEKSAEFLQDFVKEKLDNNIDNFITYNLFNTIDDKKYGELQNLGNLEKFDPDNSEIAKIVYYLVWHKKLPKIEISQIGTGKLYRGDTLNTFNTLFGKHYTKLIEFSNGDSYLLKKAKQFKNIYLCIGNFILLPNKSIIPEGNIKSETLNTYRGVSSGWKDYFDKFLFELELCMNDSLMNKDKFLFELYRENNFYFSIFNTIDKFVECNFLEKYFSKDNKNLLVFKKGLTYWNREKYQDYIEFSLKYIELSTEIIISRGQNIVKELKKYI